MIVSRYSDINIEDSSLRPYQQKAKKEIFEAWDKVDYVVFQMPTDTGKTRLFTSIIRDILTWEDKTSNLFSRFITTEIARLWQEF